LRQTARLAARPEPATLGGVQILPAGRLGQGWLLAREPAAMAPAMPARPDAVWDGRFRLEGADLAEGLMLGALGSDAARLRDGQNLPSVVLHGLPALRLHGTLVAVPHLRYRCDDSVAGVNLVFHPRLQAASAGFLAAGGGDVVLDK
jgi:tRNA(Ile)-lysidine synthase